MLNNQATVNNLLQKALALFIFKNIKKDKSFCLFGLQNSPLVEKPIPIFKSNQSKVTHINFVRKSKIHNFHQRK